MNAYTTTHECPGSGAVDRQGPAAGAKLVVVWMAARNEDEQVMKAPSLVVELEGLESAAHMFGGTVCRYNDRAFGNACWRAGEGRLYPGVSCEGWQVFEVPERMNIEGRWVKASFLDGSGEIGSWRLGATATADPEASR